MKNRWKEGRAGAKELVCVCVCVCVCVLGGFSLFKKPQGIMGWVGSVIVYTASRSVCVWVCVCV